MPDKNVTSLALSLALSLCVNVCELLRISDVQVNAPLDVTWPDAYRDTILISHIRVF